MNILPVRKELLKYFYREIEKLEKGKIVSITLSSESRYVDEYGEKKTRKTTCCLTRLELEGIIP